MDVLGMLSNGQADDASGAGRSDAALKCSRKGCKADARHVLEWNNPKVHAPERRKQWLACDEHLEYLSTFLGARMFLKNVAPLTDITKPTDQLADQPADQPAERSEES